MTRTIIVTWGMKPQTVNLAWINGASVEQRWNLSKDDAKKLLKQLKDDAELYVSVASEYSAWVYLGE